MDSVSDVVFQFQCDVSKQDKSKKIYQEKSSFPCAFLNLHEKEIRLVLSKVWHAYSW